MTRRRGDEKRSRLSRRISASPRLRVPVITLLTDFGTADYFVGAMKGVILSRNPAAVVVDITHEIPPQDVRAGAFTLLAAHDAFPTGTVHVAVVDPGVGTGGVMTSRGKDIRLEHGQYLRIRTANETRF